MGNNVQDELTAELDAILYDKVYRNVLNLWKQVKVNPFEIMWNWFLWRYGTLIQNYEEKGIFNENGEMRPDARKQFTEWIHGRIEEVSKVLGKQDHGNLELG